MHISAALGLHLASCGVALIAKYSDEQLSDVQDVCMNFLLAASM